MGRIQDEFLPCPFCDRGQIYCGYVKGAWGEKHSGRGSLGKGKSVYKSSDIWLVKSGCSVCGKSQEEVEKELRKKGII